MASPGACILPRIGRKKMPNSIEHIRTTGDAPKHVPSLWVVPKVIHFPRFDKFEPIRAKSR